MNRAHVSNLEHAVALFLGKVSLDRNNPVDSVDEPLLVVARLAVIRGNSTVLQLYFDLVYF